MNQEKNGKVHCRMQEAKKSHARRTERNFRGFVKIC